MDRGALQKEAARKMKLYVSKRRSAPHDTVNEPQSVLLDSSRPASDSGYGTSPSLPVDMGFDHIFEDLDLDYSAQGTSWNNSAPEHHLPGDLATALDTTFVPGPVLFSPFAALPTEQTQFDLMLIDAIMADCNVNTVSNLSTQPIDTLPWSDSTLAWQQGYSGAVRPTATSRTSSAAQIQDLINDSPSDNRIVDDELLMDYLDRIFYIYFPFYTSRRNQSRGWLLSVLKRDQASYHAALALTELHRPRKSINTSLQETSHHWLALHELQTRLALSSLDSVSSNDRIELLTTILHLLLYELSHTGKCNWQIHLSAASTLLTPLARDLPHILGAKSSQRDARAETDAISFLLSFFTCIDIIGSASTRTDPMLDINHRLVLEVTEVDPVNLLGCDSMVMICLLDTTSLDHWKQEMSTAHALSLVELADRGRRIEKRLRGLLANVEADLPRGGMETTEITRIYTLAAVIYLHVVISGAFSEIPEIAESVARTIDALQDLSEPKLLRSVVWPFCISGCLASSSQEHHYRKLMSPSHMQEAQFGTCQAAFGIMKECWQGREAGGGYFDWAFSMAQRQRSILLA